MSCACGPAGVEEIFSDRLARRELRRYRRSGLPVRARRILDAIQDTTSIAGRDVLEVGAGIGDLTIELLERGAARALLVDAAPAFIEAARELSRERGLEDRIETVAGDFAQLADPEPHDIVVLDRVVCCYPEGPALLGAAARVTRGTLAMSHPRGVWWTRLFTRIANLVQKLLRRRFRIFVHDPAELMRVLRDAGLDPREAGRRGPWQILIATRIPT